LACVDDQIKENEVVEAQSIELRKMDPAAIYRMVIFSAFDLILHAVFFLRCGDLRRY